MRFSIQLPEDTKKALAHEAIDRGYSSLSALIEEILTTREIYIGHREDS